MSTNPIAIIPSSINVNKRIAVDLAKGCDPVDDVTIQTAWRVADGSEDSVTITLDVVQATVLRDTLTAAIKGAK